MPGDSDGGLRFREGWLQRGFTQIPNCVLHHPDISVGGKVLYAMLLSYAWKDDHCWPGQDSLARELGASERSVRNWLMELRTLRLLTVEHRGLMQTNVYWLEALDHLVEPTTDESFRTDRQILPPASATVAGQERQQIPPMKKTQYEEDLDEKGKVGPATLRARWQDAATVLGSEMTSNNYTAWIEPLTLVELSNNHAVLSAPPGVADYVRTRLVGRVAAALHVERIEVRDTSS